MTLSPGDFWKATSDDKPDAYRDTPATELQAIVAEMQAGEPWRDCVGRHYQQNAPWLHRVVTDPSRDLFFRLHPPSPGAVVLDVGAGWGQMTLPLAHEHVVVALEPTPERLDFIRAVTQQEQVADHVVGIQADLLDVTFETKFDLVCCIGVLEWVPKFRAGTPRELQQAFLARLRSLLAPGGQLVLGIENRFGLKYLMGAADDHLGLANIAVFDPDLAARKWQAHSGQELRSFTFTRSELTDLLSTAGFRKTRFYGAFPDYKVPEAILPLGAEINEFLNQGGFVPEHDGSNGRPLEFQPELRSHYRSLARLGIAHEFAPSFYVVASAE